MRRFNWIALASLVTASAAVADVYRWVDEHGASHYSDRPQRDAEKIEIRDETVWYRVGLVFDGDTIRLADGRKIRLSGINTPEVDGRYKPAEPGGEEAKRWLAEKLRGTKIRMETDVERQDKYGRWLAHVFTEEGGHLNLALVGAGLATANIHPPNLRYSEELLRAEAMAEQAGAGLWANPYYRSRSYRELNDRRGWSRVTGRVVGIGRGRRYVYLRFSSSFAVQIAKDDLVWFPDIEVYRGRSIEVRGWPGKNKEGYTLRVRHPGHVKMLD